MINEKRANGPLPTDYFSKGIELEMASAIYNNNLDSVRLLIKEGVDINKLSEGGMTYLYFALADSTCKCTTPQSYKIFS